jgi:hypothetical protein
MTGQLQSGAVTGNVFKQLLPSVTVSMIGVPIGIEFIDHRLPPILFTVPEVLVTVPELTVTPTEYVNKSVEHVAEVVTVIVGKALTTTVVVAAVLLQPVAFVTTRLYIPAMPRMAPGDTVGLCDVFVYPSGPVQE